MPGPRGPAALLAALLVLALPVAYARVSGLAAGVLASGGVISPDDGHGDSHGSHDSHGHEVTDHGGHEDAHGSHDSHGHEVADHVGDHAADAHAAHDEGHGHGHGASNAHGGGHGHHAVYDPVAGSLAKMLFGTMSFVMALFYFLNWPDHDIVHATWHTLSDMITILCAVLIFSATSNALVDFIEEDAHHHGPPSFNRLAYSCLRVVVLIVALEGILTSCKARPWLFKYTAVLTSHVCGFAIIDFLGSALQFPFFASSFLMSCLGVLVFSIIIMGIAISAGTLRDKGEGSEAWKEECSEVQLDYAALAIGLLMSMLMRFSVSGKLPPVHGAPRNKTSMMVLALLGLSVLVVPLVMMASWFKHRIHTNNGSPLSKKLIEAAKQTSCFTMGWTLLYWGYWQFYQAAGDSDDDFGPGGKMSQRLTMAIVFSIIVFFAIVTIDKLADAATELGGPGIEHGLRTLLRTFSLLMGLSWEACFNEAVHSVSMEYPEQHTVVVIVLTLVTCSVVLPAWGLYIMPHTLEKNFEQHFLGHHESHESGDTSEKGHVSHGY